eukprot:scaffold57_cov254-Pinguiococcus_pyrenoidosus.AAC.28
MVFNGATADAAKQACPRDAYCILMEALSTPRRAYATQGSVRLDSPLPTRAQLLLIVLALRERNADSFDIGKLASIRQRSWRGPPVAWSLREHLAIPEDPILHHLALSSLLIYIDPLPLGHASRFGNVKHSRLDLPLAGDPAQHAERELPGSLVGRGRAGLRLRQHRGQHHVVARAAVARSREAPLRVRGHLCEKLLLECVVLYGPGHLGGPLDNHGVVRLLLVLLVLLVLVLVLLVLVLLLPGLAALLVIVLVVFSIVFVLLMLLVLDILVVESEAA